MLKRRFNSSLGAWASLSVASIELVERVDLSQPNHLNGDSAKFIKLSFNNVRDLLGVRSFLKPFILRNKKKMRSAGESAAAAAAKAARFGAAGYGYSNSAAAAAMGGGGGGAAAGSLDDVLDGLVDIREYDVKYFVRCQIDLDIRVGAWYVARPIARGDDVRELLGTKDQGESLFWLYNY